jgi:mannose-6-phosphate isomerase-like protein (cupin superfamily)
VLFCGVNVDQCVYATLTDAAALGYDCVLLEDCCATTSPPGCAESTLYNVAQCFGFVSSAEALCAAATQQSRRLPATRSSLGGHRAHRISAGDSVKLAVVHRPTTVYDTSVFLEIWEPGGAQPPNSHPGAVETFLFLIGSGRATCDGSTQPVRAQDFLVLPPGSVHYIENTGATRLYAVTTMSPDNGFCALVEAGVAEDLDGDDLAVLAAMSGG